MHYDSHQGYRTIEDLFAELVDQWHTETAASSSGTILVEHPAYQAIIRLGRPAVPLILQSLRREPDHWFDALTAITGEDPVDSADAGNLEKMTVAWLTHSCNWFPDEEP